MHLPSYIVWCLWELFRDELFAQPFLRLNAAMEKREEDRQQVRAVAPHKQVEDYMAYPELSSETKEERGWETDTRIVRRYTTK